ncbi:hypothetical protein C7T94_10530 [Pedobacter yulinensis]|uniref:Uncharacterized protein n=1 Tax=Pedobacter yulinensis TaxID=2126353 RepID=A0A2T3HMV5_9SPHI|nr:hypothetical protein [Pedobacter yulinensis]PST83792.1 hypothetical protein C7T94_10530 [Pedobacter yulinensis]
MKHNRYLFLILTLAAYFPAAAQTTQLLVAKNAVGKLQAAISNKADEKTQLGILGEGIKASENASKDRKTRKYPETWAINAYLASYVAILDKDEANSDRHFKMAQAAIDSAKRLDRFQDNSGLIAASVHNIYIKRQDKGNTAFKENDFKAAFDELKAVSDFLPKDTALAVNAAIAAQNMKNYDEALVYFNRGIENGVKNPAVFQNMAYIYSAKFLPEDAIRILEKGISVNPFNTFLNNDYINLLLDNEKFEKATTVIDATLKVEKTSKLLYYLYGYLQQTTKNNNQTAQLAYNKAIDLDQNYFDALYQLGLAYINSANESIRGATKNLEQFNSLINRAQLSLMHAHEVNPNDRQTIQLLIEIYSRKNSLDKVQELKQKLQEL